MKKNPKENQKQIKSDNKDTNTGSKNQVEPRKETKKEDRDEPKNENKVKPDSEVVKRDMKSDAETTRRKSEHSNVINSRPKEHSNGTVRNSRNPNRHTLHRSGMSRTYEPNSNSTPVLYPSNQQQQFIPNQQQPQLYIPAQNQQQQQQFVLAQNQQQQQQFIPAQNQQQQQHFIPAQNQQQQQQFIPAQNQQQQQQFVPAQNQQKQQQFVPAQNQQKQQQFVSVQNQQQQKKLKSTQKQLSFSSVAEASNKNQNAKESTPATQSAQKQMPTEQGPIVVPTYAQNSVPPAILVQAQMVFLGFGKKQKVMQNSYYIQTIKAEYNVDAPTDTARLEEALNKRMVDKSDIINVLARRTSEHKQNIRYEYNMRFKKELITKIKLTLTSPFSHCITTLLLYGEEIDAYSLFVSVKKIFVDHNGLREIICTRTYQQLQRIKQILMAVYKLDLVKKIKATCSKSYRNLLVSLLTDERDMYEAINMDLVTKDVKMLLVEPPPVKESAPLEWIAIFSTRSVNHLKATFTLFFQTSGVSFYKKLKSYSKTDYEEALLTIFNFITHPTHCYAKLIKKAIERRDIDPLYRIICSHCETNLGNIMVDYEFSYQTKIQDDMKKAFSSSNEDITNTLLTVMGFR